MEVDTVGPDSHTAPESGRCALGSQREERWLLLHGAGAGAWECGVWQRVLQAGGARCTALDYSAAAAHAIGFTRLSEQLARSAHAAPGAILMGASFGGLLAIALSARLPPRALVLLNPLPPSPFAPAHPEREARTGPRRWGLSASLAGTRRAVPELPGHDALRAFRGWRDFDSALLAEARVGIQLPRPRCPMLVVLSQQDADIAPEAGRRMAEAWAAELVECPGSHVAPLLGPEAPRLARLALDWSRALSAR